MERDRGDRRLRESLDMPAMRSTPAKSGPLRGLRVIEMVGIGPGPFCGMMLADLGADVVRIDRPGVSRLGANAVLDRGRHALTLDLKSQRDVETLLGLVEKADAIFEGFRPGVMERIGLGPEACLARNPRLIFGRITGWGQEGPLAHAAGHDINYLALSGMLWPLGFADRPPTPPLNLVADFGGGGMLLAVGILAALFEARRSGRGQVVDAAMVDGAATLGAMIFGMIGSGGWRVEREANMLDGGAPFYGVYETSDGKWVSIGSLEPQFYAQLLARLDLAGRGFEAQWDRRQWPALRQAIAAVFRTKSRDAWSEALEGTDVCFAPVLSPLEAVTHPHNRLRGTFADGEGAPYPQPSPRFDRTPASAGPATEAGDEDAQAVLARWERPSSE
jgi:alpha-methylacyl-CoA racemase